jgi:hypothetical protein
MIFFTQDTKLYSLVTFKISLGDLAPNFHIPSIIHQRNA